MKNQETDKEVYMRTICNYCKHNKDCDKNLFITEKRNDKTTLLCYKYDFVNNNSSQIIY